jgi:hypothetical protein
MKKRRRVYARSVRRRKGVLVTWKSLKVPLKSEGPLEG